MKKRKTELTRRKRRSRKLLHSTSAIRTRAVYLCNYLHGGDVTSFANFLQLDAKHLQLCLCHHSRLTPSMLAQMISLTNVRAEWLLCGVGPMLASDAPEGLETLVLPRTLGSAFSRLDNDLLPALPVVRTVAPDSHEPGTVTPEIEAAAKAIVQARLAGKPVWMLVGKDALYCGARPVITAMLTKKYVTGLGLTAGAMDLEVPVSSAVDKTHIAKLGAQAGFGFGEALCHWGQAPDRSLVRVAQRTNAPITVHPDFGEVEDHFRPSLRGAEVGATLGAVAYVDLLIFAESVRQFSGKPGGVCIALGEGVRFVNLFRQALRAAQQVSKDDYFDFSFVLLDYASDFTSEHTIGCAGGRFHFIKGDPAAGADGLTKACDAIFDGTT